MTRMWFLMFLGVVMILGSGGASTGSPTHHNKNEHDVLCGLLGAAVEKWQATKNPSAKKALAQAIFGNETEGDIKTLREKLPDEFHDPGNRENSCGTCRYGGGEDYPGKSIPHDLMCMCTVGEGGFPFLDHYEGTATLCGKNAAELGCEKNLKDGKGCHSNNKDWWTTSSTYHGNGHAKEHLEATWKTVVKPCLEKGLNRTLEASNKTFLDKLKIDRDRSPSWAQGHGPCRGGRSDVCVSYGTNCGREYNNNSTQWWEELYDVLTTQDDTHAQGNSTRSSSGRQARRDTGVAPTAGESDSSTQDEPQHSGST